MVGRVAVVGSTGMVGHAVAAYLEQVGLDVVRHTRQTIDASRPDTLWYLRDVTHVINCVGIIPQARVNDRALTFNVNGRFPWLLRDRCVAIGARLIHTSTDCVFDGRTGGYVEDAVPNSTDDYGLSKAVGEPTGCTVIRTSIVGVDPVDPRSLIGWSIANRDRTVDGYLDHVWNGITATEYARACALLVTGWRWEPGTYHLHSTTLTKYDLLCKVNAAFGLGQTIVPRETGQSVNRTVSSRRWMQQALTVPDIDHMLAELAERWRRERT